MSDLANLRATLHQTDNTAPAITSASRLLMSFYDKPNGPALAISEWRNVLQSCHVSQMLPLLYVANEVLQTSKRNRGNKFLEAFSPVLGSSLTFICQKVARQSDGKNLVEKVRRTVKIWGDRRIFSMRFVMDVLGGLEEFRNGASSDMNADGARNTASSTISNTGGGGSNTIGNSNNNSAVASNDSPTSPTSFKRRSSQTSSNNEDDDDDDLFGGNGPKLLDVDVSMMNSAALSAEAANQSKGFGSGAKRRRSSNTSPLLPSSANATNANGSTSASATTTIKKQKKTALSTQSLMQLFQSINHLDEKYKSSIGMLASIPPAYLNNNNTDIDDLVGDELTDMYKKVCETQRTVRRERRTMYSVAVSRRELEREAKRYVVWLKNLAKVDEEEIEFCERLEKNLDNLAVFHAEARTLREKRLDETARKQAEAEALARQMADEEERKRLLDDVKKEAEAKPGMVWNPQAREYQYLHDPTEDTWRD